ncbi:hypothetical protein HID58_070421, partial [Brassica napus]
SALGSSSANGRVESVSGSARPFAELDWYSLANGRAESAIMSSKRKSSTKSHRDRFVPEGSSSQHVGNVPKVEFSAESIDPEEVDAWRTAMGEGLLNVRELLRGRPCFWAKFSPKRVCCAVALYCSWFQPDLPTEERSESSMAGFIPYVPRTKRDRSKPCKDKHIMVDEDVVDRQFSPDNILKDYMDSQAGGSEEVSDFSKAARMVNGSLLMINRALDTSRQEAKMARFRAEVADKEIASLKDELESSRRHGRESFEKEVNHAYRRGKKEIVEVMNSRHDKFSQSFGELKGRYKEFADYHECRGTVGGLYLMQLPDYLFSSEYSKQTGLTVEKDKDPKISEVKDEIWKQWEPVPVSPVTVEAETGGLDETGEVDQPVALLDVTD